MSEAAPLIKEALAHLLAGEDLSREASRETLGAILSGQVTPAQIGGLLVAWRIKGETVEEITGFVEAMRGACVPFHTSRSPLVDLCGTGGDGSGSINISTAASLIVAASGVVVAKHGNRSASSKCGSADVLETLGVEVGLTPEDGSQCLEENGFVFLFAPTYHPAMRHAGPPRKELGIRTFFNILGPLSSPAGVKRQLIGVFYDAVRAPMAEVLNELGSEHVWVVHGNIDARAGDASSDARAGDASKDARASGGASRGLDELSIAGTSCVTRLKDGKIDEFEVTPEDAGLERAPIDALLGGDAQHNAERIVSILEGEKGPQRDAVLLNAGAALVIAGQANDLREGVALAAETVDSSKAAGFLADLRGWSA
jgi:anthranilate phosphoribosyltransferase